MPAMVDELWLMDLNKKGLNELVSKIRSQGQMVRTFDDLLKVKEMDVVITATSTPRAIIQVNHLRTGMIFIDAAQPKNVSEDIAKGREDVLVIDSGIAHVPSLLCDMQMGPYTNEAYACLGEVMALACHNQVCNFSIGKVEPSTVRELARLLDPIGFRVADFRNAAGYFLPDRIVKFRENYLKMSVKNNS
jgi:predicted amino acid dehydrogenase